MSIRSGLSNFIKVLACFVISGALGLEIWNILTQSSLYADWHIFFWFGRLALISHGIEAIAAVFYASAREKSPLSYGIYTFFVGTIGLVELFQQPQEKLDQNNEQ